MTYIFEEQLRLLATAHHEVADMALTHMRHCACVPAEMRAHTAPDVAAHVWAAARTDRNIALGEVLADMRRKVTRAVAEITERTVANASAVSPTFAATVGGGGGGSHAATGQSGPVPVAPQQVPPQASMYQQQKQRFQQQPPAVQPHATAQQYQHAPLPPAAQPAYQNVQQQLHRTHQHQQQQLQLQQAAAALAAGHYPLKSYTTAAAFTAARAKATTTAATTAAPHIAYMHQQHQQQHQPGAQTMFSQVPSTAAMAQATSAPGSAVQSPVVMGDTTLPSPANGTGRGRGRPRKQPAATAAVPPASGLAAPKPPQACTFTTASAPKPAASSATAVPPPPPTTALPVPPTSPRQHATAAPATAKPLGAREVVDIHAPSPMPISGHDEPMDIVPPSPPVARTRVVEDTEMTEEEDHSAHVSRGAGRAMNGVAAAGAAAAGANHASPVRGSPVRGSPVRGSPVRGSRGSPVRESPAKSPRPAAPTTPGTSQCVAESTTTKTATPRSPTRFVPAAAAASPQSPVDRPAPASVPATPRPTTLDVPHASLSASLSGGGDTTPRAKSADGDTTPRSKSADGDPNGGSTPRANKMNLQEEALTSLSVEGDMDHDQAAGPIVEEPEDVPPPPVVPPSPMKGGPIVVEVAFETVANAHAVGIVVEPVEVAAVAELELGPRS
ncbi:hypothetical protein AMAG_19864 [Allomyces macrogynus ATCC 38327]|uniref:Uncharacterized protein n=1 Tax=Allomyces macrogynus (strain ATCC 38327) TaxID=578462 RepID=A0A0L0T227_ALLM3|nr:hypothetical protein AMAG_19864 [Allomyces macrogynus ATCC 38327]|eukprot:KNE68801.1 hypothetical protein AMAG_19864 [Allomyces macrogynus ATCC 38327]